MAGLVSVLMPAYKAQATIGYAVGSVLQQTHADWELIIISDDGQDYLPILKAEGIADERIRCISTGVMASGPSNARNMGINAAKGDYIALLDADDIFMPEKLSRALPYVEQYGFVMTAFHEVIRQDNGECFVVHTNAGSTGNRALTAEEFPLVNYGGNAICVYDRQRIPTLWRTEWPVMEDLIFCLEAYAHIEKTFFLDALLHLYVVREDSLSRSRDTQKQFVPTKQRLLAWLMEPHDFLTNGSRESLQGFLAASLAAEKLYEQHCGKLSGSTQPALFIDCLTQIFAERSIKMPCRTFDPPQKVWPI